MFLQPITTSMKSCQLLSGLATSNFSLTSLAVNINRATTALYNLARAPFFKPNTNNIIWVAPRPSCDADYAFEYVVQMSNGDTHYFKCNANKMLTDISILLDATDVKFRGRQ